MLMRYSGDPRALVSKPSFASRENACWYNRVPLHLNRLVPAFKHCGNKARPGMRTCSRHAQYEEHAQAIEKQT